MKTINYISSKNLTISEMKEIRKQAKKLVDVTFCFIAGYYRSKGYGNYISLGNEKKYLLGEVERNVCMHNDKETEKFRFSNVATWSDATKSFRVEISNNDDVLVMMVSFEETKSINCNKFGRVSNPEGVSLEIKNAIDSFLNTLKY